MSGTVRARMKRGHLELLENVDLPEGREVSVTIIDTSHTDDVEAFTRAAGSWKGTVNADALIEQIYASRDPEKDEQGLNDFLESIASFLVVSFPL